jgi:hypothetical protein
VVGSCKDGIESLDSIEDRKFLDYLSNYQLLMKDSGFLSDSHKFKNINSMLWYLHWIQMKFYKSSL